MLASLKLPGSFGAIRQRALEHGVDHGAAIGHDNRMRIVRALRAAPDGLTRPQLVDATYLSASAITRGLKSLVRQLAVERAGKTHAGAPLYRLKATQEDTTMANEKPPAQRTRLADIAAAAKLAEEREQIAQFVEPDENTVALFERVLPSRVAALIVGRTNGAIAQFAKRALAAIDAELRALNIEP